MPELKLDASPRTITGRKVSQLRTQGWVPIVVYGNNIPSTNLQVQARSLDRTLHQGGYSQLMELSVEGGDTHNVLVRDIQRHPVTHAYIHADFYAVNMTEMQEVSVQVVSIGRPNALVAGLMVLQPLDSVEIRALPADIPAVIEVDITDLDLDNPVTISDLPAIEGLEYVSEADESVFNMIAMRLEEEEEEEIEEEITEPEILARGRQEDEDAEEE